VEALLFVVGVLLPDPEQVRHLSPLILGRPDQPALLPLLRCFYRHPKPSSGTRQGLWEPSVL